MILILIFGFILLLSKFLLKDSLSKKMLTIYLMWWGILLSISSYNPYDLYPVSNKIYFYLLVSVSCFTIGFILNNLGFKSQIIKVDKSFAFQNNIELIYKNLAKSKIFLGGIIVFGLIIFQYLVKYQQLISFYGVEDARNVRFFVGEIFSSTAEIYLYNFFVEAFSILVSLFLAFSLVWLKFNKVTFLALIYVYLYSSFGAGRFYIIELIFYVLFFYIIKSDFLSKESLVGSFSAAKKTNKKILIIILPFVTFLYGFSIYLSNFRKGIFDFTIQNFIDGNDDFFKQIIIYCVGSFRAFEYGVNNYSDKIGNTYGRLNLGGIDEIIGVFLTSIGVRYQHANLIYGETVYEEIAIGVNQGYNALFTNVFGMFLDFDFLGIVFISLFWGIIYSKSIIFFQKKSNFYSLLILVFLTVVFMLSPLKWKMQSPSSWIFLMSMFYLYKKKLKF